MLLLLTTVTTLAVQKPAHLGLLINRASPGSWCGVGAIAELSCALALHDVTKSSGVGPWALTAEVLDTGGVDAMAVMSALGAISREDLRRLPTGSPNASTLVGFVGPISEETELAAALTTQRFAIVGASATTASLRPRTLPHWTHIGSPAAHLVAVAAALVSAMRWQRLSVVAAVDATSQAHAELFIAEERRKDVEVVGRYDFGNTESQIARALSGIEHSHARVIVLSAGRDATLAWLAAASHHSMTGRGWTYIIIGGWCGGDPSAVPKTPTGHTSHRRRLNGDDVLHALDGAVCIGPSRDDSLAAQLREFVAEVRSARNDATLATTPALLMANATLARAEATCTNFGGHAMHFASPPPPPAASLVHDACYALAFAVNGSVSPNSTAIMQRVRTTARTGGMRSLRFDAASGERIAPPSPHVYNYFHGSGWKDIGALDVGAPSGNVQKKLREGDLTWSDGQTSTPPDRVQAHNFAPALYSTLVVAFLALSISLGHWMHTSRLNKWVNLTRMPQAAVVVAGGVAVGIVLRIALEIIDAQGGDDHESGVIQARALREAIVLDDHIFFLLMLPIIIFESSYNMEDKIIFFKNIGLVAAYAVIGTIINTCITGGALSLLANWGALGIASSMRWSELFAFAAAISAVDPVATLGVLSSLGVPQRLFVLVMGESIVNDAVAVALFRAFCDSIVQPADASTIFGALLEVVWLLVGSIVIGAVVALLTSMLFKLLRPSDRHLEAGLVLLLSYAAFTLGESVAMSGIIASLAAGLINNYFTQKNMTQDGIELTQHVVGLLAHVSESIIFFMVGVNIIVGWKVSRSEEGGLPMLLIFFTLVMISVSRLFSVLFISGTINAWKFGERLVKARYGKSTDSTDAAAAAAFAVATTSTAAEWGGEEEEEDDEPVWRVSAASDFFASDGGTEAEAEDGGESVVGGVTSARRVVQTEASEFTAVDLSLASESGDEAVMKDGGGSTQTRSICGEDDGIVCDLLHKGNVPLNWQVMMWHAGLRGAIAFVLVSTFPSQNVDLFLQTTCVVILWTIFLQGGTTFDVIHLLRIEAHGGGHVHAPDKRIRTLRDRWENQGMSGKVTSLILWVFTIVPWSHTDEETEEIDFHVRGMHRRATVMKLRRDNTGGEKVVPAPHAVNAIAEEAEPPPEVDPVVMKKARPLSAAPGLPPVLSGGTLVEVLPGMEQRDSLNPAHALAVSHMLPDSAHDRTASMFEGAAPMFNDNAAKTALPAQEL